MSCIFITGASSGIGLALAHEYAQSRQALVLLARRADLLTALKSELESRYGARVLVCAADVTDEVSLRSAAQEAEATFGGIDTVIANAGYGVIGSFETLSIEHFENQFAVNVFGMLKTIYATLPLLKRSRGRLCLIGSTNAYLTLPGTTAYCMSKHAVRSLAAGLHAELTAYGVSVTLINPGFIDTEIRTLSLEGKRDGSVKDPVPAWLKMPAPVAARKIRLAVEARKREIPLTLHSRIGIWLARFAPGIVAFAVKRRPAK